LAEENVRRCEAKQKLVVQGGGFGHGGLLSTPVLVTMRRKRCDCSIVVAPCMHVLKKICAAYIDGQSCPDSYEDCSLASDDEDASYAELIEDPNKPCSDQLLKKYGPRLCRQYKQLDIVAHTHNELVVFSTPGYGRRLQINVQIGGRTATISTANKEERYLAYLPPSVSGFEVKGGVFRPDGKTELALLGNNLGYGSAGNVSSLIEVRIGTDYDVNGQYCGMEDRCMKVCEQVKWFPEKNDGGTALRGFPFIQCRIPQDVAGFKNISLSLAGQVDDCRSNSLLCGLPINFPTDRRVIPPQDRPDNVSAIAGSYNGLVFTCAKADEVAQSYARPGERCESDLNSDCADTACTSPLSHPGFWRLDLDLSFACGSSTGGTDQCQTDITGKIKSTGLISLDSFTSNDPDQVSDLNINTICHASSTVIDEEGNNQTKCAKNFRQCQARGINAPGTCVFRRPTEARRALGANYWPWSCPGVDLSAENALFSYPGASEEGDAAYAKAHQQCRNTNQEAYAYVASLQVATCPQQRVDHLINYTIYEQFPSLVMSDVCYGIVACNPKESCLGGNTCGEGYEYNKFQCLAYNKRNAFNDQNCSTDHDCRTRSGGNTEASSGSQGSGLSSACDPRNPQDCSRCVKTNNQHIGKCECVSGGPRCALCRVSIGSADSHDGKDYKGYFRLNDECQECPDNPGLLLGLMGLAIVVFCVGGWWMQDKEVNVAFLSIGVDYFQVLAIFARIKIRWPLW
jgi:hypothetical protein